MIDFTSVTTFINSEFPPQDYDLEHWLLLEMKPMESVPKATAELARWGYLGCLPIAYRDNEDTDAIVIRLLPNVTLARCPIGLMSTFSIEGNTFASDISYFVAGHMAEVKAGVSDAISSELETRLFKFATYFGSDVDKIRRVLACADQLRQTSDFKKLEELRKLNMMRLAVDPDNLFNQILFALHEKYMHELGEWASDMMANLVSPPSMVLNPYILYHTIFKTGVDVSDAVWELSKRDMVFDASYSIIGGGLPHGGWKRGGLYRGGRWLIAKDPEEIAIPRTLWEGVKQFVSSPEEYDGSLHLAFAREAASENPELAYTHACNAACQWVRATGRIPAEAIRFAHELAVTNQWDDLKMVLSWTREGLNV